MTDIRPKISVIVTTYNQEATIARTLESILAQQTAFQIEIVIGEDCSTDGTPEICRQYAERYPDIIRLFSNNSNKGLVDNYFDCLLECRGEYIADCAGDDWWIDPFKLAKQASVLDNDPEISLVHTGWNYHNEVMGETFPAAQNRSPYHRKLMSGSELIVPLLCRRNAPIIHLCTSLYRRDKAIEAYRSDTYLFRSKEFTCEDLQLAVSMCQAGKIAYLQDITLNYSIGTSTISSEDNHDKTVDFYIGTIKLTRYLQLKCGISDDELESYYVTDLHFTLTHAFKTLDMKKIDAVKSVIVDYEITMPFKSRLLLALTGWRPAWKTARAILTLLP